MAYAAMISLESALANLGYSPRIPIDPLSIQPLDNVLVELEALRGILKGLDATSKGSSRKKVNALDAEIKAAVWKFEDLVESHLYDLLLLQSDSNNIRYLEVNLQVLWHDIDSFVEMLKEKAEQYLTVLDDLDMLLPEEDEAAAAPSATNQIAGGRGKFKMVGHSLDMLTEVIRTRLDSSGPVDVVPVVGMAGIGKTAIAREIFDDPESESGFDCRVWVSVGRKPPPIHTIKRDILAQLDPASKHRRKKIRERDVEHC